MSDIPVRSHDATFDAVGFELVKSDIQALAGATAVLAGAAIPLTGAERVMMPVAGSCAVWAVSDTATVSTVGNLHTVRAQRGGQNDGSIVISTLDAELLAFVPFFLGSIEVGAMDQVRVSVTVTGAPSPTLSIANFTILCYLTPRTSP